MLIAGIRSFEILCYISKEICWKGLPITPCLVLAATGVPGGWLLVSGGGLTKGTETSYEEGLISGQTEGCF